ncbi:MAG: hypothetical protein ACYC7L_11070 [Nitrospirota bacterium]
MALVVVLVVTAVALALLTTLIYMITTGTQISGMQKRYKTALEAGYGAADITFQMIALRGDVLAYQASLGAAGIPATLSPALLTSCTSSLGGTNYTQLAAKLMTATSSWSAGCGDASMTINPLIPSSYDMKYEIGTGTKYNVYAKIVDATEGNSAGGGEALFNKGVVSANSGEVTTMSMPYLYTIEVDAESAANSAERAKLTILYQY